jgi:DNA-directed RNA polymerase specialized sigma24 family protein
VRAGLRGVRRSRATPADDAGAGAPLTLELLYECHHAALLSFCRYLLLSRTAADAALEQTFVRAAEALGRGAAPANVRAWLFTIARNRCLAALASRRDALDEVPRPLEGAARLPVEQRAALALADVGNLPPGELARVLGMEESRARALVHRARIGLMGEPPVASVRCKDIRAELAVIPDAVPSRRALAHLRHCAGCRAFDVAVAEQRARIAATLPAGVDEALHARVLDAAGRGLGPPPSPAPARTTTPMARRLAGSLGVRMRTSGRGTGGH